MDNGEFEYVGFWPRVGASIVDSLLVLLIVIPLPMLLFGSDHFADGVSPSSAADFLVSDLLPAAAVIAFWMARQATPGKMLIAARIVDAKTGAAPTLGQCLLRYLGYFVSIIVFGLGLVWVAFDARKQGWHDKIAGTVVVRPRRRGTVPVTFENR